VKIKQPIDRIEAFNQSPMARNPRLPAATARVNNAVALGLTMALPKQCADYLVGRLWLRQWQVETSKDPYHRRLQYQISSSIRMK